VPTSPVKVILPAAGVTYVGPVYPSNGKIQDFGFDKLPDWKKSNVFGKRTEQVIATDASGVVRSYVHNGKTWRTSGSINTQSETPVKIGAAVAVSRSAKSARILEIPVPYSL
jgi:hypothetical protein